MKIALLYKACAPEIHWNCLEAQEKNMGAIPPLNLCYVAAIMRRCGHEVRLIDLQVEAYTYDELVREIRAYAPALVGFTITTYLFHPMLEWITALRAAIDVPVLIGGFHMSLYPQETMMHRAIDFGICGMSPETIAQFLRHFETDRAYDTVAGLCYKREGCVVVNPCSAAPVDLDNFPFPARDLIRNEQYGNFISQRKNFAIMLTGIGCPFHCKYCASTLAHCRMRSPENVVDEIEECVRRYGVREIDFYDQTFTIDRKRTLAICDGIVRRKLDVIWTIRTRADMVDEELLVAMKKAGLYRIMYGVESGDPGVLARLNKQESLEKIRGILLATKRHGIAMLGFFMLGCPGETRETLARTQAFIRAMPFDDIQVTRFTLFPGTAFYDEYRAQSGADDYWRAYVLDRKNVKKPPLFDTAFTPDEIDECVRQAYLQFYLQPRVLWRRLLSGDLVRNGKRYARALIDMLKG